MRVATPTRTPPLDDFGETWIVLMAQRCPRPVCAASAAGPAAARHTLPFMTAAPPDAAFELPDSADAPEAADEHDSAAHYRYTHGSEPRPLFVTGMAVLAAAGVTPGTAVDMGAGEAPRRFGSSTRAGRWCRATAPRRQRR